LVDTAKAYVHDPPHNVKRKSLTIMAFFVSQQWELQQMNHGYGHISALNAP